jgi:hypothetical protein
MVTRRARTTKPSAPRFEMKVPAARCCGSFLRNSARVPTDRAGMAHNVFFPFLFLSVGTLFLAAACSGGDGSSGGSGSSGKSVLDSCSGAYVCVIDGDATDTGLTKAAGRCYLGQVELGADGTTSPVAGSVYKWSGDASRLDICQGTTCFSCYPSSPPASSTDGASAKGHCVGSASSCSEVGAYSCSDQRGCHYTVGATLSTSDDGCEGDAAPCSDFDNDSDRCGTQHGCSWQ